MTSPDSAPPPHARGYEGFEGRIGRTAADSTPSWPTSTTPIPGSPNIVVVLIDDMGYSDIGPFGSEIETPHPRPPCRAGHSDDQLSHDAPLLAVARSSSHRPESAPRRVRFCRQRRSGLPRTASGIGRRRPDTPRNPPRRGLCDLCRRQVAPRTRRQPGPGTKS